MKIKAAVELKVAIAESGIQVGETLITWGLLLANPGARAKISEILCTGCCTSPPGQDLVAAGSRFSYEPLTQTLVPVAPPTLL